jgi:hypothetical protein
MRWMTIAVASAGLLLVGCQLPSHSGYPPDPLLIGKPPFRSEAMPSLAPTRLVACEPVPPPRPEAPIVAAQLTSLQKAPIEATTGHRRTSMVPNRAVLFAAAPDRSWIQGALSKELDGAFLLRYREAAFDAPISVVRLLDDPRLRAQEDGAIVRLVGQPVPPMRFPTDDDCVKPPYYRIERIEAPR